MQNYSLITSLVTGFGLALPFGYLAERFLRSPALVGYILAGVAVGIIPGLPPVNEAMIEQLAEIGVMLLMFGVGLHFSVRDLLNVRTAVVPWAAVQMMVTAILGACVAMGFWHWSFGAAVLFGLTISCASTVVVTKALELRRMTNEINGQVAIGWLVMEDLMSVVLLVCLPPFAQAVQGADVSLSAVAWKVATTLIWAAVFVVLMLVAGRKVMPRLLREVALTGSNELFTLSVLGCAIVIAYGAGAIFNVSFALGAFFAGMVMQESRYAHRAATDSLPLQDAFSVLFFVSVGMMLDWHVFLQHPIEITLVVLIIIICKMTFATTFVTIARWPLETAFTVGACNGQIGEFSYILAAQGIALHLVDSSMMSIIVAASIITIAFNPVLFEAAPKLMRIFTSRYAWARRAAMRPAPFSQLPENAPREILDGQMIVVGLPEDGAQAFFDSLLKAKRRTIVICGGSAPVDRLREAGIGVLFGSPSDPMVLVQAHVLSAGVLVIPSGTAAEAKDVVDAARKLNKTLPIVVLTKTIDDGVFFDQTDKNLKILCEPLVTSLTVAATAIEELFQREESEAEEEANRKTVREIINEEYMRTVAAVRTGGASDAAESESDKLQAAAVTVADEAMSEAKRQTPVQKTLREAARGFTQCFLDRGLPLGFRHCFISYCHGSGLQFVAFRFSRIRCAPSANRCDGTHVFLIDNFTHRLAVGFLLRLALLTLEKFLNSGGGHRERSDQRFAEYLQVLIRLIKEHAVVNGFSQHNDGQRFIEFAGSIHHILRFCRSS